jgi:hyperosmotically inducible periplasmic protein
MEDEAMGVAAEEYVGVGDLGEFPELRPRGSDDDGRFAGCGPRSYVRPDERIIDDICERLTRDPRVDASYIEVRSHRGEVTLGGSVGTWIETRWAGEIAADVYGVRHVQNDLRVAK